MGPRCGRMPDVLAWVRTRLVPGTSTHGTRERYWFVSEERHSSPADSPWGGLWEAFSVWPGSSSWVQQWSRQGRSVLPQLGLRAPRPCLWPFPPPEPCIGCRSQSQSLRTMPGLWRKWRWASEHKTMSPGHDELLVTMTPAPHHLLQALGFENCCSFASASPRCSLPTHCHLAHKKQLGRHLLQDNFCDPLLLSSWI